MEINKQIESLKMLAEKGKFEIFYGLEGYTVPLTRRIELAKSPIKQIINGQVVAQFHQMTDDLVKNIISTRVEKGLMFKNLIRQEDKDLAIELSNSAALKETRLLPAGFQTDSMIAVFGDTVTITSLNKSEPYGIIITDKLVATTFESMFDAIWTASTPA